MNTILANTLSGDAITRQDATQKLENACRDNYLEYMITLSDELANETTTLPVRSAAALVLKNALSARETARQSEYTARWLALDNEARNKVKQNTLSTLGSSDPKAGHFASQVVAAIAGVELPNGLWQDLIEVLLGYVNEPDTNQKIATLQAIGFICETIKPQILSVRANEILTAIIQGARKEEPSPEVQLTAIRALFNSLEFVRGNFEREGERNYIMQVICEATQNPSVEVQGRAFECLVRIMSLYYDKMSYYMEQALFQLTVMGMKHTDQRVALQAVEFWSTVCDEEIELAVELQEATEYGELPETESKFFAKIALPEIVPVLLMLLTRQEEDAGEDEWNISMAAGVCLGLLSAAVQDAIVPAVIPFIEAHIKSQDWHHREAAVMAFGSILDGPDPQVLTPLVTQALGLLIDMMGDADLRVKDTTAWTLSKICDLLVMTINADVHLHPLISALVNGLQDHHSIISHCCYALQILAEQLGTLYDEGENTQGGPLTRYYEGIIQALMRVTEVASREGNYRNVAYEAISSYVTHAPTEAIPVVQNIILAILERMERLLGMQNQILGVDDRNNWNELQSNLCSIVISVVRKLNDGIQPLADRIMTLVLQLIQAAAKTSTVLEDAFMVIQALAFALKSRFAPYIQAFLPFLYPALKAHEDPGLCSVAVGLVGDISGALGEQSAQYAGDFMTVLLQNLQSEVLNRNVKIVILSCFGDIALAIGPAFSPYLDTSMGVLRQAGAVQPNPLDYDLVDYVGQLREGILTAYAAIIAGFGGTDKVRLLLPHAQSILELVQRCLADDERSDAIIGKSYGIIGDLADCFPDGELKDVFLSEWIASELRSKSRLPPDVRKLLRWARDMVKRATA